MDRAILSIADRMEEKTRSEWDCRAPDCLSMSSSVSLKTANTETGHTRVRLCTIICKSHFVSGVVKKVRHAALTWSGPVDAAEKILSSMEDAGGQRLMAAHLLLEALKTHQSVRVETKGSRSMELGLLAGFSAAGSF